MTLDKKTKLKVTITPTPSIEVRRPCACKNQDYSFVMIPHINFYSTIKIIVIINKIRTEALIIIIPVAG